MIDKFLQSFCSWEIAHIFSIASLKKLLGIPKVSVVCRSFISFRYAHWENISFFSFFVVNNGKQKSCCKVCIQNATFSLFYIYGYLIRFFIDWNLADQGAERKISSQLHFHYFPAHRLPFQNGSWNILHPRSYMSKSLKFFTMLYIFISPYLLGHLSMSINIRLIIAYL